MPLNILFTTRKNLELGIPDMFIILFTGGIEDIVFMALVLLPMATMFTKICPKGIEATCYALLVSIANFRGIIRSFIGTLINDAFLHVTKADLSDYWKMSVITSACVLIPIIFIKLVPT